MKKATILVLVFAACLASGGIVDSRGREYREIVLAENAPPTVKLAAAELQKYLKRVCDAELEIVNTATVSPAIYVGLSDGLKKLGLSTAGMKAEGYAMKSGDGWLALYGRDYDGPPLKTHLNPWRILEVYNSELQLGAFGEAGTLTAVNEFLQAICGIRFYMPGEIGTVITHRQQIAVPELDLVSAPRVNYRYPWFCLFEYSPDSALWFRRVGFGGTAPMMIIHNYRQMNKYRESNPEFFALIDGKRAFKNESVADGNGHLCLTNPDVIKTFAAEIIDFFKANPEFDLYPLGPQDGLTRICQCPTCAVEARPDAPETGKFSYHIWNFTAKVAAEVAKVYPDKFVGCLAYEKYRTPPAELGRMKNVAVMFCSRRSDMTSPAVSQKLRREITEWSSKVERVYLWNWYLDHWLPWSGLPVVHDESIQRELTWLFNNPLYSGEFLESERQNRGGMPYKDYTTMEFPAMQHWNLYVTARMHMHPDFDLKAAYEEYCRLFYGSAAGEMKKFWDACRARRTELLAKQESVSPDILYTTDFLEELKAMLAKAAGQVKGQAPYDERVAMVAKEFEFGASRLIRVAAVGAAECDMPVLNNGMADLNNAEPMRFVGKNGETANPATWMWLGYDRRSLYLKFLCFEPEMEKLRTKITTNDEAYIWEDDSIEIFLCPDESNREKCFAVTVNANGVVYDWKRTSAEKGHKDMAWSCNAKVKTVKKDNCWILEVEMPLVSIGITDPNFTGNLAAQFYRNRLGGQGRATCWNPTGEFAHFVPQRFGILKLR